MTRHVVCRVEDLPPGSRMLVPLGKWGIGVFNVGGRLFALNNYCPHVGGPVCLGALSGTTRSDGPYQYEWIRDGEILSCPWHAWEFDISTGVTITQPERRIKTYEAAVENGQVIVDV